MLPNKSVFARTANESPNFHVETNRYRLSFTETQALHLDLTNHRSGWVNAETRDVCWFDRQRITRQVGDGGKGIGVNYVVVHRKLIGRPLKTKVSACCATRGKVIVPAVSANKSSAPSTGSEKASVYRTVCPLR